jgi:hypothetical protein
LPGSLAWQPCPAEFANVITAVGQHAALHTFTDTLLLPAEDRQFSSSFSRNYQDIAI